MKHGQTDSGATPAPAAPAVPGGAEEFLSVEAAPDEANEALDRARSEAREARDRMLRMAADFDNFKKRNERERLEFLKFSNERLIRELLPVADNLARAVDSARRSADTGVLVAGVDLVLQDFLKALRKFGVEPIDAVGRPFDPALHEALQQVEVEGTAPGTVVSEAQRGFLLNGRVLRPSLVTVAANPEITSPERRPSGFRERE